MHFPHENTPIGNGRACGWLVADPSIQGAERAAWSCGINWRHRHSVDQLYGHWCSSALCCVSGVAGINATLDLLSANVVNDMKAK